MQLFCRVEKVRGRLAPIRSLMTSDTVIGAGTEETPCDKSSHSALEGKPDESEWITNLRDIRD